MMLRVTKLKMIEPFFVTYNYLNCLYRMKRLVLVVFDFEVGVFALVLLKE